MDNLEEWGGGHGEHEQDLAALDLEAGSDAVLARAVQLASMHAARLIVLHVIEAESLSQTDLFPLQALCLDQKVASRSNCHAGDGRGALAGLKDRKRLDGLMPDRKTAALVCTAIAALIAVGLFGPIRYVFLGSEILIAILFALSLNLLMGYGGMLSFGHAAYYALAAYTSGLLQIRLNWHAGLAMVAGPVVAGIGAVVFGVFVIRGNRAGPASFLMLTLAFSQLVFAIIYKWYDITRGDDGISGISAQGALADPRHYFLFVIAVVVVCMVLLARIKSSPFGIILQAIRDNPERAAFAGIATRRYQLLAFVIAGAFAGVAGTLYAFFSGTISPQLADWTASARPFLANTMGGIYSFWGPVVGVVVFELMNSQIARFTEYSLLAVGILSIVVGVFLPDGLVGLGKKILQPHAGA